MMILQHDRANLPLPIALIINIASIVWQSKKKTIYLSLFWRWKLPVNHDPWRSYYPIKVSDFCRGLKIVADILRWRRIWRRRSLFSAEIGALFNPFSSGENKPITSRAKESVFAFSGAPQSLLADKLQDWPHKYTAPLSVWRNKITLEREK